MAMLFRAAVIAANNRNDQREAQKSEFVSNRVRVCKQREMCILFVNIWSTYFGLSMYLDLSLVKLWSE